MSDAATQAMAPHAAVAIVGAGFSGTLLALHLLRRAPPGARIALIERNAQFGRGAAYGTGNSSHLLNVPAGRMSAFQNEPDHFLDWLRAQDAEELGGLVPGPGSFVPRHIFGRYVRHLLNLEMKRPERRAQFDLYRGDVLDIAPAPEGGQLTLSLDRDRRLTAGRTVLAIGNFPPAPPAIEDPSFYDGPCYRADPWGADTLTGLDPDAPVLLIGTGLTMVDTMISLLDQGHRGSVTAISRRGLLPLRHAVAGGGPAADSDAFPTRITALARFLREGCERRIAEGGNWQSVIDELRPITADVWQTMALADRARFLRHIRPWWEVHRHRLAGLVADRIDSARATGQLAVHAGRILRYEQADGCAATAVWRPRFSEAECRLEVARVVNCSGPNADYRRLREPLLRALLDQGAVRPDPLSLGLDVTGTCALRGGDGAISRRLFAVGPVTKGAFWEMTAVPDIRQQCEFLAGILAPMLRPGPASGPPPARDPAVPQPVDWVI